MMLLHVLFYSLTFPIHLQKLDSQLIANTVHSEIVFNPMLQIVETAKEFVIGNFQDSQKYKFCKLTLVYGDFPLCIWREENHIAL